MRAWSSIVLAISLAACGGDGADSADAGPVADGGAQPSSPDFTVAHSRIVVSTYLTFDYASLSGYFADGPPVRQHVPAETEGNCRIMRYTPSSCTPACSGNALCVAGSCVDNPGRLDRGALAWSWPDGTRTVQPDGVLTYFAEGGATRHGTTSIAVDGIELALPTASQPTPDGDWAQAIESRASGADVSLRWTNAEQGARVRLHMTDCTGSHGGLAAAELECDGADTGELVLPGAFVDIMANADWSRGECGSHVFQRYYRAEASGESMRFETVGDGGFFWRPNF